MPMNDTRHCINALKEIIREPIAWPGLYTKIAVSKDGGLLCASCCKNNYKNALHSTRHNIDDGFNIQSLTLAEHLESSYYCDKCGENLTDLNKNRSDDDAHN